MSLIFLSTWSICWVSQGGHSEPILLLEIFLPEHSFMLKVMGLGGGSCDFSVSQSPLGLDFGTLDN